MEEITQQKILLVDDRPENILALESILDHPDRELVKAYSGKEALRCLLNDEFALILLDVQMPEMDGFETASLIRGREKSKNIPIIFVTAISNEEKNIFRGYEAGAVDFLHKPLNPDILDSKVKIFLELDRQKKILEYQNYHLAAARKNTDDILANIGEGLFLLDKDFNIQPQYSVALENILDNTHLANNSFLNIIKDTVDRNIYDNAIDYLDLLLKQHIKEVDIVELNPLINVEYFNNTIKDNPAKYLSFHFKRIKKNGSIDGLMVTVLDNTDQILLKRKLKEAEESSIRQAKLMHVFQMEPQLVREFLIQTEKEIKLIRTEIDHMFSDADHAKSLQNIYQSVHSIKGNANLLNLEAISNTAHNFEDILTQISGESKLDKEVKSQLNSATDSLGNYLHEIQSLIDKVRIFYQNFDEQTGGPGDLLIRATKSLIDRLNQELNKNVAFNCNDFNTTYINTKDFLTIKDILIQMIRNAMFHGIEDQAERAQKKKDKNASIKLSSAVSGDSLSICIRDDGRGIPLNKLKEKAIATGKWTADQIKKWDRDKVANLIFEPAITTSENTNLIAGRGIGMQIVKQKIEDLKGKVKINFEEGKFTEFVLELPFYSHDNDNNQ